MSGILTAAIDTQMTIAAILPDDRPVLSFFSGGGVVGVEVSNGCSVVSFTLGSVGTLVLTVSVVALIVGISLLEVPIVSEVVPLGKVGVSVVVVLTDVFSGVVTVGISVSDCAVLVLLTVGTVVSV